LRQATGSGCQGPSATSICGRPQLFSHQVRIDSDILCFAAITLVAPGVRFSFLAILATPCLSLAIDFIKRRSSFDHASLTIFFFFFANLIAPFLRSGLLASDTLIAMARRRGAEVAADRYKYYR
jgi:hypothetical protein